MKQSSSRLKQNPIMILTQEISTSLIHYFKIVFIQWKPFILYSMWPYKRTNQTYVLQGQ